MSSPLRRRAALQGKNVNAKSNTLSWIQKSDSNSTSRSSSLSPIRRTHTIDSNGNGNLVKKSPSKRLSATPSPLKRRQQQSSIWEKNAFTFFEESSHTRDVTLENRDNVVHRSQDDDKENESLKSESKQTNNESKKPTVQRTGEREPLSDLDISKFRGYVEDPSTRTSRTLDIPLREEESFENSNENSPIRRLRF